MIPIWLAGIAIALTVTVLLMIPLFGVSARPVGTLTTSSFDAVAFKWDTGESVSNTPTGVFANLRLGT